ncbi:Transcription factor HIVEP3 [Trichinella papuae]|uniref:Transcription factor HIVEP3 n=1 Tax=Trichinella papuae TaxID=268474 RepID=A0A0V1MMZ4_9BILA|nr:Transcription factor HIVEP3 [Trichinella papuae]
MSSLALVLAADQEADCQNRILVDVAPVVGSGTSSSTVETASVDGRGAFLTRQNSLGEQGDTFNAAAAAALYSQYAVIQQQYTAALAAVARAAAAAAAAASRSNSTAGTVASCLTPSMPYPYLMATAQQFVSNLSPSTVSTTATAATATATAASDSVVIENSSAKRKRSLTGRLSSNNTGDSSTLNEQQQQQPSSSSSSSSVCCLLLQSRSTTTSNNNITTTTTSANNNNNNNNSNSCVEKIFSTAGRESPAMGATRVNHKAVEEHISRLISENEALLEPSPVLLKRRSYTRQHFGSFDQGSSTGGHRNISANVAVCSAKQQKGYSSNSSNNNNNNNNSNCNAMSNVKTMRSQSLVDAELLLSTFKRKTTPSPDLHRGLLHRSSVDCGRLRNRTTSNDTGSLSPRSASVEAVHQVSTGKQGSAPCAYCSVGFRNVDACKAHEIRCAQRPSLSANESPPAAIVEASSPSSSCSFSCCSSNSFTSSSSSSSSCSANSSSPSSSNVIFALQFGTSITSAMQPYCNTVRVPKLLDLEPMRSSQNQPSLITQSTFCTVRRRPVPQQKLAIARQSIWLDGIPQSNVNISTTGDDTERRTDAHFNILLMGCYRLQKLHHMPLLCYTTAVQELAHSMRMTHSSYWKYSKKLRKLSKLDNAPPTTAIAIINNSNTTASNTNNNNCTSLVVQLKVDQCRQQNSEKNVNTSSGCTSSSSSWQRSSIHDETCQRNQNLSSGYKKGRGRGRYVCERCGIRCKKPSVLKKHFRCHLDIRPYSCPLCMFSFKSKGNLTKHMKSKAHSRRSSQQALTAVLNSSSTTTSSVVLSSSSLSSTIPTTSTASLIIALAAGVQPATTSTIDQIQKINVEQQQFTKSDEETSSASEMEDFYYNDCKGLVQSGPTFHRVFLTEFICESLQNVDEVVVEKVFSHHCKPDCFSNVIIWLFMLDVALEMNVCMRFVSVSKKNGAIDTSNRLRYFKQGCRSHTPSELAAYSEDDDEEPERCSSAPLLLRRNVASGDHCPDKTADSSDDAVSSGELAPNCDLAAGNCAALSDDANNSKQLMNEQQTPALDEAEQQRQDVLLAEKENESIVAAVAAAAACAAPVRPDQNGGSGGLAPVPAAGSCALANDFDKFYSSMTAEGRLQCPICGKRFNKYGLLRLHENVHAFEQSNRKARHDLKCPECHCGFRSRALLHKHMLNAHPVDSHQQQSSSTVKLTMNHNEQRVNHCGLNGHHYHQSTTAADNGDKRPAAVDSPPDGAQWSTTARRHAVVNASVCNPRPFQCADCDSAFRIHGHLAKHLRSKLHIMKLESVGKLPVGTFARIEELGVHSFHDMDTSSSENALRSLLRILANNTDSSSQEQRNQQQQQQSDTTKAVGKCRLGTAPATTALAKMTNSGGVVVASVTAEVGDDDGDNDDDDDEPLIDVEGPPPPPPQPSNEKQSKVASPNPPEPVGNMKMTRELPSQPGRSVVAGLWVPPTSDQLISAAAVVSCRTAADHAGAAPAAVPVDTTVAASSFFFSSSCSSSSSSSCSSTFNDHAVVDSASSSKSLDNAHLLGNAEICCDWCQVCFPSAVDLEVHMHTDHILMRDGRDYRCTLANCDKIYPNMDCLRQHVKLHFVAGGEQLATAADLTTDYPRRHYHHQQQQQQQQPTATAAVLPPSSLKPTPPKRNRRTGHNNSSNRMLDQQQQQQQQQQHRSNENYHRTTVNYSNKDNAGGNGVVVLIHGGQMQNRSTSTNTSNSNSNCISSPTSDSEASRSSALSRSCGSPAASPVVPESSSACTVGVCIPTDLPLEAGRSGVSVSNSATAASVRRCSSLKRRSSLITTTSATSSGSNSGCSTPLSSATVHCGTSPLVGKRARICSGGISDPTTTTTNNNNSSFNNVVEQKKLLTSKIQQQQQAFDLQATPSLSSVPSCSAFLPVSSSLQHFAWNQPISPHLGLTGANNHPLLFAGRELLVPQPHGLVTGGAPSMPVPAPGFSPLHFSHFYDQLWAASVLNAVQNYAGLAAAAATPISPTVVAAAAAAAAATATCGVASSSSSISSSNCTTTTTTTNNNNLLVCFICCKQCSNVIDLQEHMLGHSQPRPYVCEFCDAGFTSIRALQAHRPCRLQNVRPMN